MPQHEQHRLDDQGTQDRTRGNEHTVTIPQLPDSIGEEKSKDKLAKDTGCCLYSAISFLVIMLVTLGLVLMFIGPTLSQKVHPPEKVNELMKNNGSARQIRANKADIDAPLDGNELMKDPAQPFTGDLNSNKTDANSTLEELSSPEALTGGYLAYIPFQEEEEEPEEYFDYTTRQWRIKTDKRTPPIIPLIVIPMDSEETDLDVESKIAMQNAEFDNDQLPSDVAARITESSSNQRRRIPGFRRDESRTDRVVSSKFLSRKRPPSLLHPPPRESLTKSSEAQETKRLNPFARFRTQDSRRRSTPKNPDHPSNPMSIRDIIDYMTRLGDEEPRNQFSNSRIRSSPSQRLRNSNSNRYRSEYERNQVEKKGPNSRRKTEPYSFLMDVYPYRNGQEIRTPEEYNSNRHPVTDAPSQQVIFRPETANQHFFDLNSGDLNSEDLNSYQVQYNDQLQYPTIPSIPSALLPLETTTNQNSFRQRIKSSTGPQNKQVVIHLNLYNGKSTDGSNSRGNGRYRHPGDSVRKDAYLTPDDIYRSAVEVGRNRYLQGEAGSRGVHRQHFQHSTSDDYNHSLPSDQSYISQQFEEGNLYDNHNMDDDIGSRYRYPGRIQYPSASAHSVINSKDIVPESLPRPMARK